MARPPATSARAARPATSARSARPPAPSLHPPAALRPSTRPLRPSDHPDLARLRTRTPTWPERLRRAAAGPFADLTPDQRATAESWLARWTTATLARLALPPTAELPPWRRAILIGNARKLALHPTPPTWSRSCNAAKMGYRSARARTLAGTLHAHCQMMNDRQAWIRAGRPALPSRQLPLD